MADHAKPTILSLYSDFVSEINGRMNDLARGLDPATSSPSNLVTAAVRWSSASKKWQKWDSTAWVDLATTYAINISGSAATLSATLPVSLGGTGRTTCTTPYGLIAAGTTATGGQQTLPAGATNQMLVGGGASALPAWVTTTGSGAPVRADGPTITTPILTSPAITGGSADNTPIGATAPSTGAFSVLTEAGKAAVTQADIGTDPNKIPLNGMLGDMAYQSKDGVRINGGIFQGQVRRRAPVTKTSSFTVADAEHWIICNGAATITVTLPDAASNTGREIMLKTIAAYAVVSASSNVVPLSSSTAGAAILAATAGKWATMVSDGINWVITQGN